MSNTIYTGPSSVTVRASIDQPDPQHLALLLNGVNAWNRRRDEEAFRPNLSGADIYAEFSNAGKLENGMIPLCHINFRDTIPWKADLHSARLESADFRGAILTNVNLQGADLKYGRFGTVPLQISLLEHANLYRSDLRGADLQGARLIDAHLVEAKLKGADLRDAEDYPTELHRANLSGTQPWKAKLYPTSIGKSDKIKSLRSKMGRVSDVEYLLKIGKLLGKHYPPEEYTLYFRGDTKLCDLCPSVLRRAKGAPRIEEGEMLRDLASRRPEDFGSLTSALDQLVLARHYGLQTRLLDISRNPLVALYHACSDAASHDADQLNDGRVHIFAVPNDLVKPFDSDTISVVANFARLRVAEQNMFLGKREEDVGQGEEILTADKYQSVKLRLNQFINQEKPYFEDRIDPRDLYRVFVVEPRQSFGRIRSQSGAFLLSAFHERFERDEILSWNEDIPVYDYYTLKVPRRSKEGILEQLRLLNTTHESLYPGLESAANAVNDNYPIRLGKDDSRGTKESEVRHKNIAMRVLRPLTRLIGRLLS